MSTQIDITIAEVWKNGLAKQGEEIEWNIGIYRVHLQAREMNGIIADIQKFDKEM